jgi:hypothetical protein
LAMKKLRVSQGFTPIALLIYGAFIILTAFAGILVYKQKVNAPTQTASPTALPITPSSIPTQTPKPVIIKAVDPDPITDCVSSAPNCSGESIRLRTSQCYLIVC